MADLTRLKGSERVRQCVNVMFGNSDVRGCQQGLFEVGSNSIDRFKKGYGDYIKITKHKDLSYTVEDCADGLPMEWNEKEKGYNWDIALKVLYGGDNYKHDSEALGEHGLGLTTTQYSSEYMTVISYRDNKKYIVKFKKGRPIDKNNGEYICEDDDFLFTKEQGNKVLKIEDNNSEKTGTIIHYKPDLDVFTDINIPIEWIIDKFKKQAYINTGIKIDIYDEINDQNYYLYYENGLEDYIKEIGNKNNLIDIMSFCDKGNGRDREDKPVYDTRYEMVFTFNNTIQELKYFHNSSELLQGGVTAEAINKSFTDTIHNYIDKRNMYKKDEKKIKFCDIEDSLICIISSFSTYTSYSNQTKLSIDNKFIKEFITESLKNKLEIYFTENELQAKKICETILNNMRARTRAEKTKLNIAKKLNSKQNEKDKVKVFYGCVTDNPEEAELYVAEGSSAQGSVVAGRNSQFQACIHVGGKMLSLLKADYEKIFNNKTVVRLFRELGCGIEIRDKHNKELNCFDESKLKYHKIILATDSDTDAYNIRTLILTALYRLTPTLIEKGYVYIAESPLYEITDLKGGLIAHVYTELEKINKLKELDEKGVKYKTPERNKGLGEVSEDVMAETMMNPETRKITQITVKDAKAMANKFDLWLGKDVKPRKKIISNNFDYVEYFEPISKKDITQILDENYLPYAIDVIKERAIISIDGFKPSHRKLLWTLHEQNLYNKRSKSMNVVGANMSYNIHGDGSIYETLVRMGQKDTLLYPYVNGKGNFGQHTSKDLQPAHARYTESGASEINKEFFKDINKNAVDFIPNFDGQKKEPMLLPTTFPNVLVNANEGIAVGMASRTPSFNLIEVCNLTTAYIKNKNINVEDYLLSPDFATKGYVIINNKELRRIYDTGKGSIKLRGNYYVKDRSIFITEIPYTTNREAIIDKIEDMCNSNEIKDVTKVIDATDYKKGNCIQLNIKKNTNVKLLMEIIYKNTKLEDTYSFNMNIVCLDKIPRVMGVKQILEEWLKFRYQNINRVIRFEKQRKQEELHKLKGIAKVLLDIDKLIEIIKNSTDDEESLTKTMEYFKIDRIQAQTVIDTPFKRINKTNFIKRTANISELKEEIEDLNSKEDNKEYLNSTIIKQLGDVKNKYGQPRKTEIIYEDDIQEINESDLIEEYSTYCLLTKEGYLKKLKKKTDSVRLRDNDKIISEIYSTNKSTLLLFSSTGVCYKIYENELNECKPSNLGEYLPQLLKLDKDEKIISMISTLDYKGYMINCFDNGKIAKVDLSSFKTKTKRSKLENAYNLDSKLINQFTIEKDMDILCKSSIDKVLIVNTSDINSKESKNTKGVNILKAKKDSTMKLCIPLDNIDTKQLEDINYYKGKPNAVGTFLRKTDKICKLN
ncbi:DNA gyrase subunit A [Clostridium botulinum]